MLQYNVKILRFILLVLPVPVIEETDDPFLVAVRHGCKQLPDIGHPLLRYGTRPVFPQIDLHHSKPRSVIFLRPVS